MSRLTDIASKLTPAQLLEVEDFAAFLSSRPSEMSSDSNSPAENRIDVAALAGLCEGMGATKTAVELVHDARRSVSDQYTPCP
jgi:hypothetical protein